MLESFRLGSISVEAGNVGRGYWEVCEFSTGAPMRVPIIVLHGSRPGPKLWVEACIHGDEYDGTIALLDLSTKIRPGELAGTLILLPALNIPAFLAFRKTNPSDGIDMLLVFPGSSDGSFTEQYAHKVLQEVIRSADYLIDLHSGGSDFKVCHWSIYEATGDEVEERSERIARSMLAPAPSEPPKILWRNEGELLKNAFFAVASRKGVPSVIFEGRGGGQSEYVEKGIPDRSAKTIEDGIVNVLKTLGMIEGGSVELAESEYVSIKGLMIYYSKSGGIFRPLVRLGEKVSKDQTIATVTSLLGDVREVKSPLDGIVPAIRTLPVVAPGMDILELGNL